MDDRLARAEAIEGFAAVLRELRESVGNPSFREMAGRSGVISHTTLHEAAKGNRLPSWETTVEFVKACGAEPDAYRERWEKANRVVRPGGAGGAASGLAERPGGGGSASSEASSENGAEHPAASVAVGGSQELQGGGGASTPSTSSTPPTASEAISGRVLSVGPRVGERKRPRRVRPVAAVLAVAVVGAGAALVAVVADRGSETGGKGAGPSGGPSGGAFSPENCPVRPTNPPPAPPLHEGDMAEFIADITLPDCTRVAPGKTFTKVWRIKNAGTVPWKGYSLSRLDSPQQADECQTIAHVPIRNTRPGKMVDIRTEVTTPRKPGLCYVRFKMVDASERIVFPGNRPLNFQLIVR